MRFPIRFDRAGALVFWWCRIVFDEPAPTSSENAPADSKGDRAIGRDDPSRIKLLGLGLGPLAAAMMLLAGAPGEVPPAAWHAAAAAVLMAVWWITEPIPLAITALLPLVLFPPLGIGGIEAVAPAYADPLILLFLAGFMLAAAMQRHGLHRWLALRLLRLGGRTPASMVASMMAATAFLSMWVSNTATAMVMLPIGQSIIEGLREREGKLAQLPAALILAIAYAATIGGMATLVGTPPNALFASFMQKTHGISIGFFEWMLVGLPVAATLLPATWLVLTRVAFTMPTGLRFDATGLQDAGPLSRPQKLVGIVLVMTAAAWISRPLLAGLLPGLALSDAGIAMTAVIILFILPSSWLSRDPLLIWSDLKAVRWDVLILFGGGLALADAIAATGLAQWLGQLFHALGSWPAPLLVLAIMVVIVYLGELASNTAIAAIFLPVAGAAALGLGEPPLMLALPVAMAASLGFMLPVATPPNAIVYGSGLVTARQMLKAGTILDVLTIPIVAALAMLLGPLLISR